MSASDPILDAITAPGSPFELASVDGIKRFANAPQNLDQFISSAQRHGDQVFIVEGDRRITFTQAFALRDALAASLAIEPGDRVAICMRNRAEWLIGYMAVVRAGGVVALINSRGSPDELATAVSSVDAKVVLSDGHRAELLRDGGYQGRIIEAADFPPAGASFTPPAPAGPDDPAAILFTSGTTGRVKGAVLTHRNVITGIMSMQMAGMMVLHNTARQYGIPVEQLLASIPRQAVLLVYPLFHISGMGASFLSPLVAGSKIVILPKWDAKEAARAIAEEKITMFSAVPTMLWDMLRVAQANAVDLSSLTNIGTGGQALPINLLDGMRELCPQAVMGTGYGLTETTGTVAMAVGEDFLRKRASAGRVVPLVEMRVEAPDGSELPRGEAGEIVVRSAQVMQGYWGMPGETAEVLSADGWLRTGDVGYLDEEGYLFIVDRKKDMVISGGENIYCAEVERVLSEIPEISECATFGIPDDRLGELLVAVVRADGLTEDAVIAHVGDRLARYKAPAKVVFLDQPLPRNHLDKVDKIALRTRWNELGKELT
ncbi:MAG: class I adenylate-forming enzyme family protein [Erythrobacter sp.]|uniref:class I adenylate-forming enzyme family protein n=1 Tax=Erythrobacter sp. TaxID=1042 RepID=UPI003A86D62E